jgi:uncharacterized protein YcbX
VAPAGVVLALNRYPVKSMAGQPASSLDLWPGGVVGDRAHALYWRGGRRLTARVAPRMLAWQASYNGSPVARVTAPDGRSFSWEDEGLRDAISDDLGKEIELVRDPDHLMQDLERSVLVTVESTHAALEGELARDIDLRRFRPNVHVRLEDAEPFAELGWEGRRLRIGAAELEFLHPCVRCVMVTRDPDTQEAWPQLLRHLHRQHSSVYGINARPLGEATINVGDPVEVL